MIIKLRKYNEIGELLIGNRTAGSQARKLSGRGLEGICNQGGCPHGVGRDGDANRAQGRIQMGSESGMSIEMRGTTTGVLMVAWGAMG